MLRRTASIVCCLGLLLLGSGEQASALPDVPPGQYFGAYVGIRSGENQQTAIQRVEAEIGRQLTLDHEYYRWDVTLPTAQQTWDKARGTTPLINWKAQRSDDSIVTWSSIAAGAEDTWIAAQADRLKAFNSNIYLAFHHEPEDEVEQQLGWGTAADYVAAFKRVVNVFKIRGATNVFFVWDIMNWTFNPASGRNPLDYYPGDSFVTAVGADGYNEYPDGGGTAWEDFYTVFHYVNDFAVAHNKYWIAAEFGTQEYLWPPGTDQHKHDWFTAAISVIASWPKLKAVVYFDTIKEHAPNSWQSDSSPQSITGYSTLANSLD